MWLTIWMILLAAVLAVLGLSGFCWREVFWVRREATLLTEKLPDGEQYEQGREGMLALIRSAQALPFETVHFTCRDGSELYARYYEKDPAAPLQIQFHGYRSNPIRDFSGGAQLALECGCNVLLVDQRAHGRSEGNCLSFGILERLDCLDWVHYARERFGTEKPIILAGISMGAATVLMASELALPDNVVGILADCGYTSPRAIIRKVAAERHYPVGLVYPLIRLGGMLWGGFDIESASAVEALGSCRIPVLFIHGEDDRFVPCRMSRENYEACASEKTLLTVPGAGHGLSFVVDRKAYTDAVRSFLERVLPKE